MCISRLKSLAPARLVPTNPGFYWRTAFFSKGTFHIRCHWLQSLICAKLPYSAIISAHFKLISFILWSYETLYIYLPSCILCHITTCLGQIRWLLQIKVERIPCCENWTGMPCFVCLWKGTIIRGMDFPSFTKVSGLKGQEGKKKDIKLKGGFGGKIRGARR